MFFSVVVLRLSFLFFPEEMGLCCVTMLTLDINSGGKRGCLAVRVLLDQSPTLDVLKSLWGRGLTPNCSQWADWCLARQPFVIVVRGWMRDINCKVLRKKVLYGKSSPFNIMSVPVVTGLCCVYRLCLSLSWRDYVAFIVYVCPCRDGTMLRLSFMSLPVMKGLCCVYRLCLSLSWRDYVAFIFYVSPCRDKVYVAFIVYVSPCRDGTMLRLSFMSVPVVTGLCCVYRLCLSLSWRDYVAFIVYVCPCRDGTMLRLSFMSLPVVTGLCCVYRLCLSLSWRDYVAFIVYVSPCRDGTMLRLSFMSLPVVTRSMLRLSFMSLPVVTGLCCVYLLCLSLSWRDYVAFIVYVSPCRDGTMLRLSFMSLTTGTDINDKRNIVPSWQGET